MIFLCERAYFIQINAAFGSHRIGRRIILVKNIIAYYSIHSSSANFFLVHHWQRNSKIISMFVCVRFVAILLSKLCVFRFSRSPHTHSGKRRTPFQYCIGAREPSLTNEAYWIISLITFLTEKKKTNGNRSERNTKLFSTLSMANGDVCAMWHGCRTAHRPYAIRFCFFTFKHEYIDKLNGWVARSVIAIFENGNEKKKHRMQRTMPFTDRDIVLAPWQRRQRDIQSSNSEHIQSKYVARN